MGTRRGRFPTVSILAFPNRPTPNIVSTLTQNEIFARDFSAMPCVYVCISIMLLFHGVVRPEKSGGRRVKRNVRREKNMTGQECDDDGGM